VSDLSNEESMFPEAGIDWLSSRAAILGRIRGGKKKKAYKMTF